MPRGLGLRFAVEAAFLVAVAVVAVVANFRWPAIVIAMAAAWGAVSVVEWWLSRSPQTARRPLARNPETPVVRRREPAPPQPAPEVELPQHVRVLAPPPPVERLPQPEPEPEPAPEPAIAPAPEPEPVWRPLVAVAPPPPPPPEPVVVTPPPPPPEPAVVTLASRDTRPREWNLWDLERATREHTGDDPARAEERNYLLMYLREFASPDGALPVDFDGLVRDAFGDLLAAVHAS
ncbi:MAG: hypothetical protein ACYDA3_00560 [Gaiellaceae bacterium]